MLSGCITYGIVLCTAPSQPAKAATAVEKPKNFRKSRRDVDILCIFSFVIRNSSFVIISSGILHILSLPFRQRLVWLHLAF